MSKFPPSFSFYAEDFLSGCMYLTMEEKGMYITMLCKQWTDEGVLKSRLKVLVGKSWEEMSDELRSKFIDYGEIILNERLEEERVVRMRFLARQRANGSQGGRPKKKPTKNPNKTQTITQTKPTENPSVNPNKTQKNPLKTIINKEDRYLKVKDDFINSIKDKGYKEKYSDSMLSEFIAYWTEPDKNFKARFEGEKYFDVGRRLATWKRNQDKFNPKDENKKKNAGQILRERRGLS